MYEWRKSVSLLMTWFWRKNVKSDVFTLIQEMKNLKKIPQVTEMRKNWNKEWISRTVGQKRKIQKLSVQAFPWSYWKRIGLVLGVPWKGWYLHVLSCTSSWICVEEDKKEEKLRWNFIRRCNWKTAPNVTKITPESFLEWKKRKRKYW